MGGDAVPMMDYPAPLAHPQLAALGAIVEPTPGRLKTVADARFSETQDSIHMPPPTLGQHNEEVLRGAGIAIANPKTQGNIDRPRRQT
jgi:crotonobetainyl-CoA:carnitine CoA-transferase CaiB-like acyl-CoA transferase